jgi:GTP-binding protein
MKQNIVAIIGRPNVGKSTLFNRLIEKRDAIVDSESGVTRDRNYAEAEWAGSTFTVIDTGGYVPHSKDIFEKAIREQSQFAIEEADKVIFVVDALEGLTPLDEGIAEIIRKLNKNVFLVVNKIDNTERESLISPFYSLGIGDPFPLSALSGRNTGDFLDLLVASMKNEKNDKGLKKGIKFAIIGRPNVGKSSFVNALLGFDRHIVTPIPGTTRDSINSVLKHQDEEYILIDTAGLRKRSKIKENIEFFSTLRTLRSIQQCDVAIVLIDAVSGLEHQDKKIINDAVKLKKGVVVAVNKWDLVEKDSNTSKKMEKKIKEDIKTLDYLPLVFISALTKQRIFKIIEVARDVYEERSKKLKTRELNSLILAEIQKTPPSSSSGKEIKINYITQVKVNPPVLVFFVNNPKLIQESYMRFLERKIRQYFSFTGVPLTLQFRKK